MAAKGSFSAGVTSAEIVPANEYREQLVIQLRTGTSVSLAFGTAAVLSKGYQLMSAGSVCVIDGALAGEAVYAISAAPFTGGYQEALGIRSEF
ncbi:MAG: hypothetical protein WC919_02860 [Candidatus Paceibacterota bacterium]|jgi:hypothetical protein